MIQNEFREIQAIANLSDEEMYRTFNCGIGMMIFVSKQNFEEIKKIYSDNNIKFYLLGKVEHREENESHVEFVNCLNIDLD